MNLLKSVILEENDGASEGAAPLTVKEIRVRTIMTYSVEVAPSRRPSGVVENSKIYEYTVELNAGGEVIGGHWLDGNSDRPDFVWRETMPAFQGYFKRLKKLYEDGTAQ